MEGTPIFVTIKPFVIPTRIPEPIQAIKANQKLPVAEKTVAKRNPDKAITDGKERSISPIPSIKVKPRAINPIVGTEARNEKYMLLFKKTLGLVIIKNSTTRLTIMIRPI
jgi:hypothetical protein